MKHNCTKLLLPLLLCVANLSTSAHDFEMDGIYYNITSSEDLTVEVTYRGYYYSDYSNEYSDQVTIPETVVYNAKTYRVTSIGGGAFYNCSGLTSVTIPNSVTSIGDRAFYNCSGLTSVTIPNSVTSIGGEAFGYCSGLTSVHISDVAAWCKISFGGSNSNPLYYAHHLYIGENEITDLVIPNSLTSIGGSAFYGCSGLTSVTIPNSVTSIGNWAFAYCSGLTSVTIPNSVTSIGDWAFAYCSGLTSVTIPNSVTSIGDLAFYGANLKKTIWLTNTPPSGYTYAAGTINYVANEQYTSLSNKTVYPFLSSLFEVDGIKYVPVSPSERTCDAIDCVLDSTAAHTKILSTATYRGVTLKVLNVKPYVCYNNDFIKDLVVDNDGIIATSAFENCDSLETAVLGKKITALGDNAFKSCAKLKSIIIPDSVKTLGAYSFSGCSSLTDVHIGNGLEAISNYSFSGCTALKSVYMGTGVKKISEYSFSGCSALETIHIGASVKEIGSYAFQGCKTLPTIAIPAATTYIKDYVFNGCTGLKTVLIEDRVSELNLGSNDNSPLFADCPLDSVYIGGNITYSTSSNRGYPPFYRNTTLRSVTITDKETEISPNEFYGCTNLQNVRIGDGVTTIGDWAFSGCSSLSYFAFGTKVKSIGKEAFSDCTNVSSIISNAATPPVCGSQALDDINKWGCTLYVPKGYTKQYQEADQWKEFFFVEETDFVPPIDLTEEFGKDFFTDISILVSEISAENYNNKLDVNGDGKIDIGDIVTIIRERGPVVIVPTPQPSSEAKGDGTEADPFNSIAANAFASALASGAESDRDVYIAGKVVSVKEQYDRPYGNATFYISDDGTATNQFYVFRALYLGNVKYTSGDLLQKGDDVVICGRVTNYLGYSPETVQGKAWLVSLKSNGGGGSDTPGGEVSGNTTTIDFSAQGYGNAQDISTVTLVDGTTLTFSTGSNKNGPKYYDSGSAIRMFPNNSVAVSAKKKIASIAITCSATNAEGQVTASPGTVAVNDMTVNVSGIGATATTITNVHTGTGAASQLRISELAITYE